MASSSLEWLQALPKAELHLHLEGAIPLDTLWQLAQKYGGDPEVPDQSALAGKFQYSDFPHFLEMWHWKNRFIREYDDFTFFAEAIARDLQQQNIRYVEAFYSPGDFERFGLTPQRITQAMRAGLDKAPGVRVQLIADLVRDREPEKAACTLRDVVEVRDQGVIGIGLGGSEHNYPAQMFEQVFEDARRFGLHTTAHAGEASGADSVRAAVEVLKAERIGHGIRAIEDPSLVRLLAERRIPLEVCPISNLCTGVVRSMPEHPIRRLFDAGVFVTINTDDPKMFGNSLVQEYQALMETFAFTETQVQELILAGIKASWLDPQEKLVYKKEYQSSPAWR
jgi:adenosine deaminase